MFDSMHFSYLVDRYCKEQLDRLLEQFDKKFLYMLLDYFDTYCEQHLPEHYQDPRPLLADGFLFVIFLDGFIMRGIHDKRLRELVVL